MTGISRNSTKLIVYFGLNEQLKEPMPEAIIYKEKRVSPRIKVDIPILYHRLEDKQTIDSAREEKKRTRGDRAIDISLGGLQIKADQILHNGDILDIEISLPGLPLALPALAEVVWANENLGGLHFLKMSEEDVQVLKAFLNKAMKSRTGA